MRLRANKVFCVEYLLALVVGFYIPGLLIHWVPNLDGTTAQVMSFAMRFGIAYVLMISMWIAIAFFSARTSRTS
jgi:hypothetical protein